ncbi:MULTISPECIES: thermostable hemolysin [Marinomonas]|uniref:Thermostable hemolysin n=1 Tax=Marinomonas arctica TaxID=383750 RepID=A0A7H1J8E4_9GAMM|nr:MULTISPECIES: thermostable hemolysin [Marinomonas]MCS7487647.1 hypothetical protein [Marinomonas sp. BSi20414]QNT06760.1 thermostable hemolysin [Marinomonas arctica]GGN23308.1 hypothetical protein GCM10011350_11520 [Marinomonas arctica]
MQPSDSVHTNLQRNKVATPTMPYEFVAASMDGGTRRDLENFVKDGFAKKYQADINTFMPILLGIRAQGLRAVMGVRRGNQPLFVEQYLPMSITESLQKHGIWTERTNVAELGNLYSQNQRFTLPLLMTVVMGLYLSEVNYLVFAGTDKVRQLLGKLKLPLTFLADANPALLQDDGTQWGSYYDNNPKVMFLDVKKAVALALQQPELEALMDLVQANFQHLLLQLRNA